ncbi:MAG: COX15/CtaA family protein [Acidimicrobiales bacterium]
MGLRLSPPGFRRVAGVAVLAIALTIVSGAAVRLTGSGLGCADWPRCTATRVVAPLQFHAWMEFGNRLVATLLTLVIVGAVAGSLLRRPRRADLVALSAGLIVGVAAQIVLGGETVLHHLAPQFVMSHFLLSGVLLADAVVLWHRAGLADRPAPAGRPGWSRPARTSWVVPPSTVVLARLVVVAASAVVVLGTVVTSTGPHGGDPAARRFAFSLHDVAQIHGGSVEVFGALTLLALWSAHRAGAPAVVMRRGEVLLGVLVAQAAVGYAQYFSGDPALTVGIHVAGAASVMVAVGWFYLSLRSRAPDPAGDASPATTAHRPELVRG